MLQQSIYTHIFAKNERFFIYNSKNSLLSEISEDLYEVLYNRDYESLPENILTSLKKQEVIVEHDDRYNHYRESKIHFLSANYDPTHLSLVIAPTTGCNFDCPYCFEGKKESTFMSDEVEDQITQFIKERQHVKTLTITWYGGEPLIALDRIKSLHHKISSLPGIELDGHGIITNGYLLTSEVIEFFKQTNLRSIQVTLDGNEKSHNKTRCLKGSCAPTYSKIVENLQLLQKLYPSVNLSVRVNINRNNYTDFIEVYDEIGKILHNMPNLRIYPGLIREETNDQCSLCYTSLSDKNRFELLMELKSKGGNVDFMPAVSFEKGCMINNFNAFIIGPAGEIYKCWNEFNHPEKIIGYISSKEFTNKTLFLQSITESDIFNDQECKDCLTFPTCKGKCGYYNLRNKYEHGRYTECPAYKDTHLLEEALLLTLDKKDEIKNKPKLYI